MKLKKLFLLVSFAYLTIQAYSQDQKFWQRIWLKWNVEESSAPFKINNFDWDPKLRNELINSSDQYFDNLINNNSIVYEPELEFYLKQKLFEIYPEPYINNPYAIIKEIVLVKSPAPDVQVLNNGKVIITTGMLALTETEDELMAILAQQIGQFVYDLNLKSYKDQKNSQIATQIIGATATIATTYALSKKSDDYSWNSFWGESAGIAATIISGSIFNAIASHHNLEQVMKTDQITLAFLNDRKLNLEALGNILDKIWKYAIAHPEYSNFSMMTELERYPKRLNNINYKYSNEAKQFTDKEYDKKIADVFDQNALLLIIQENNAEAIKYLDRLINANYAIEETYLLKAIALRKLPSSTVDNNVILDLLEKADLYATNNSENIDIERGLAYYRLNNKPIALKAFLSAKAKITSQANFSVEQLIWVNKMIARCRI